MYNPVQEGESTAGWLSIVLRTTSTPLLLVTQQKHSDCDGFTFSAEIVRWFRFARDIVHGAMEEAFRRVISLLKR